jgi:thymidylate synthase
MENKANTVVFNEANPTIVHVIAETLPEAWEAAVIAVWENGTEIATQYDKPGDLPSKDATATITIRNPTKEPRIHRAFPGGIEDLEIYRQEVVCGIHDHWIAPEEGKWEYSYHQRLFNYDAIVNCNDNISTKIVNQIDYIIEALSSAPHTRRAQAITWQPWKDCGIHDPSCLQSIFMRIFDNELIMNIRMRSNDLFKATFMNLFAFIDIQRLVAEKVSEKLNKEIKQGQVVHMVDSLHLYSQYNNEIEGFLKTVKNRTFDKRVYFLNDPMIQDIISETKIKINKSLEEEKKTGRKGI